MVKFVETHRGSRALHFKGYAYSKIRDCKEGLVLLEMPAAQEWSCPGRATSEGPSVVVRHQHNLKTNKLISRKFELISR